MRRNRKNIIKDYLKYVNTDEYAVIKRDGTIIPISKIDAGRYILAYIKNVNVNDIIYDSTINAYRLDGRIVYTSYVYGKCGEDMKIAPLVIAKKYKYDDLFI